MSQLDQESYASSELCIYSKDFFKFSSMKMVKKYMKIKSMVFPNKIFCWASGLIWTQKWRMVMTMDLHSGLFLIFYNEIGQEAHQNYINCFAEGKNSLRILHNERDKELHENYINGFSEKVLLQGTCTVLGPKNSRSAIRIFFNFAQ